MRILSKTLLTKLYRKLYNRFIDIWVFLIKCKTVISLELYVFKYSLIGYIEVYVGWIHNYERLLFIIWVIDTKLSEKSLIRLCHRIIETAEERLHGKLDIVWVMIPRFQRWNISTEVG